MLTQSCRVCGRRVLIRPEYFGKRLRCPVCWRELSWGQKSFPNEGVCFHQGHFPAPGELQEFESSTAGSERSGQDSPRGLDFGEDNR